MKKILFVLSVLFLISCSKSAEEQHMNAIFNLYGSKVQGVPMDGGLTYEFDLKELSTGIMPGEFKRKVRDMTDSFTNSRPELEDYPTVHEDGSVHGTTFWHTPKYRITLIEILNNNKGISKVVYQLVVK